MKPHYVVDDESLQEQYDEEESWEEKGFLEGMEEAEGGENKKKPSFDDELHDEMTGNIESEFEEQFGDNF